MMMKMMMMMMTMMMYVGRWEWLLGMMVLFVDWSFACLFVLSKKLRLVKRGVVPLMQYYFL